MSAVNRSAGIVFQHIHRTVVFSPKRFLNNRVTSGPYPQSQQLISVHIGASRVNCGAPLGPRFLGTRFQSPKSHLPSAAFSLSQPIAECPFTYAQLYLTVRAECGLFEADRVPICVPSNFHIKPCKSWLSGHFYTRALQTPRSVRALIKSGWVN